MAAMSTSVSREDRERETLVIRGESLHNADVLAEAVQARLNDPLLTPKSKASLKQILKTAQMLQRTLKKV
jgi:hypothetical protein